MSIKIHTLLRADDGQWFMANGYNDFVSNADLARNPKKSPPQADPPMAETTDYTDDTDIKARLTRVNLFHISDIRAIRGNILVFYSGS